MSSSVEHVSLDRVSVPVLLVVVGLCSILGYAATSFSETQDEQRREIDELNLKSARFETEYKANMKAFSEALRDLAQHGKEAAAERQDIRDRVQKLEFQVEKSHE